MGFPDRLTRRPPERDIGIRSAWQQRLRPARLLIDSTGLWSAKRAPATRSALSPDHFDSDEHRALRDHLVDGAEPAGDLVPLLAQLDALAARQEIDEQTTKELLLRLRERHIRRLLAADPTRADLIEALERVHEAVGSLV